MFKIDKAIAAIDREPTGCKNGRTYSFISRSASDPPEYEVGEQVPVLYGPADPDREQINKWSERWRMPVCVIPAMIFGVLLMNFFMLRAFRRNDVNFA
jgi:hypothetical protein